MAMYQAAVSKRADNTIPSGVMEELEVCSLPGGLASVRKQFETQETATAHNVTQFQSQHRTVQEMSNSEVTVSSSARQVHSSSQQLNFNQATMVSYSGNNVASSYENHNDETEEDFPRYTTKELRDHFERTIEEAAPHKQIKIGRDINRSKWSSNVTQKAAVSEMYEASATEATECLMAAVTDYDDFPPPPIEDSDDLPPPPPDLLPMPPDMQNITECCYSPEPTEPANLSKYPANREAYFKQRNMYELKRLYKHIHPEVRKNIEKEYCNNGVETENNQLESQEYTYEDDAGSPNDSMSPDQEYFEWDEVLQGEVQELRWMFENKPLDAINDETLDEDSDHKKISQQEIILGKDVRRTAWMFETKPMDALGSHNINSTEYKNKFNKFDKGDVRAAAWLFETQTMDNLNKMHVEEDLTKEIVFTEEDGNATIYMIDNKYMGTLGHTETIDESHLLSLRSVLEEINGEVKTVTSTFDTQFRCIIMGQSSQMLEIKSVRKIESELENSIASRWLFDTQPLDMTNGEYTPLKLVCSLSMEDSNKGDWGRWLFEIKTLNSLSEWEGSNIEKKDIIGTDVRKHCLVFETQPMDFLKDDSNAKEEIVGGNVRSARNFFEGSPQAARKSGPEVGKLKKKQVEEDMKGDVRHQKWRFESQPLEHIREERKEVIRTVNVEEDLTQEDGSSCRADVRKNCWVFETQSMDTLKDDSNTRSLSKEEIIAGNVRSARHYFETIPNEEVKELAEVGKLKKTVALNEERGDVRHQKWRFESQPLEEIREEKKEIIRTIDVEEFDKVDVSNYKQIFETTEVNTRDESQKILIEGVTSGSVKSNKNLFESTQLYAMQDSSGHFHEVKTVRREEIVKGDVTTCKWMFETRPIDQFDESINKYQIIKGISKQEIESGDVKTAKWLFETQPLDSIKFFSNIEDEEIVGTSKNLDVVKGDVKTCKWLFETKPMDILYERGEFNAENVSQEIPKGDVKTCSWLFETQALDTIHDETETVLKTCTVNQEDIQGKDVRRACFLFETEKLENLIGEESSSFKRVTEIDIASGDVSRMKYIFENQTSDIMTSTSDEAMQKLKIVQSEDIQKGNVVNCKWLFENQTIDTINDSKEESMSNRTVNDVQGGDVDKGRFIFETCSLDKIQEASSETDLRKMQQIFRDEDEKGDVRNYTMMFETQPLYAIQDKEGHYHEVTTVTSEEVVRGDVVGTRWLFETKPIDSIRDTDEVYVIKSVTQEDVQKGDVTSAKWKFETQPLDRIADENKTLMKTVDDIQGGNVRMNMHRFESDNLSEHSVRTVNVSEIQKGDVRTAKWRFETQSIDKIRGMSSENLIETVKKEEVAKGDVKQSVWLFEKNPLDHIKEVDEGEATTIIHEEIPKADVKTTTWLFETTPFDDFNESKMEKTEILGKSVKGTLEELYTQKMVKSKGVLIEADEIGDVRMAKYQLMHKQAPEIQREEVIRGDLQTIMMNLLNTQQRQERQVVIDSEEKGNISSTVHQLFNQERDSSIEKQEILRGDIREAINKLFNEGGSAKHGILIQEDEKGDVQMTIYSLLNKQENVMVEKEDILRGDIKSALQKLSNPDNLDEKLKIKVDDTEKGNVNFYSTCIESGALDYLKQLHVGPDETQSDRVEKEKIVGGDIKGTKLILGRNQTQIERTVGDVIPGDVHNTVKVFMTEPTISSEGLHKEEIVRGDLRAALNSLSESVNQTVVVEKEEVVKGNIPKALRCLEKAQKRYKEVEKPDIIPGNIKGALRSLEKSTTSKVEAVIEDLVHGDVKATLKSLELAKQAVRDVEKAEIVRGDIHTAMQCLQDASSEKRKCQQEIDVQGDVRGTIQFFLESPPSPRMQRRASLEDDVKGDVKMSIKSLYEMQEQTQLEKEEVIKGDVKGTIKSLLETAHRETPKVRVGAYRRVRVKQSPPVKNQDAQRNIQKIKTANISETSHENHSHFNETEIVRTKKCSVQQSAQQSKTVVEHRTITQSHGIKTLKTDFRNLRSNQKGMRVDKTKVKTDIYFPKPHAPEPDLPLPPPPPLVVDIDLPPPPTPPPPSVDTDIDHLPPPPPPLDSEQDFLPPPPSQQELESMPSQAVHPSPAKAKRMTVKKVKAPNLHQVTKLEPKVQISKTQQVEVTSETVTNNKTSVVEMSQSQSKTMTETSKTISCEFPPPPESPRPLRKVCISPPVVEMSQSQSKTITETSKTISCEFPPPPESPRPLRKVCISPPVVEMSQSQSKTTTETSKTISCEFPPPPESPRPLRKVCISPVKFTPPPSPPPFMRGKMSRFNTPLIKAEEKYRKLRDEHTPPRTPTPTYIHESVTAALEMLSTKDLDQANETTSNITQEKADKSVIPQSDSILCDSSKHVVVSGTTESNAIVSANYEENLADSVLISSEKQQIISNESSTVASVQKTSSVLAVRQQMCTTSEKMVSITSKQTAHSVVTDTVQTSICDVAETENTTADSETVFKNLKTKGSNKYEDKKEIPAETVTTVENLNSYKSQSEDNKTEDNIAPEVPDDVRNQPTRRENGATDKNVKSAKSPPRDNKKKKGNSTTEIQKKDANQPMQTETAVPTTNGKTTQKAKKNYNQEDQVGMTKSGENEKEGVSQDVKVRVKEAIEVKVISEQKEVRTEIKQEVKKVNPSPAASTMPAVTASSVGINDNQPATPTPPRRKKKSKKAKGGAQSTQNKDTPTQTKMDASPEKSPQTQETTASAQIHKSVNEEQIQVQKEVTVTESKEHQSFHKQEVQQVVQVFQKSEKESQQKKGVAVIQLNTEGPKEKSRDVPITVSGKCKKYKLISLTTESGEDSQRQEVQVLISHITQLERDSEKTDSKSVKTLLDTVPEWLMSPERKRELEGSTTGGDVYSYEEILSHVKKLAESKLLNLDSNETMEKHDRQPVSEKVVSGGATPRISKISIGSAKVESQTKKTSQDRRKDEVSQCRSTDLRSPSPLLRMRSPSPTFITIESTRRTDSPQRVTPSPTLLHRPATPPTPPPRRCETPTSRLTRITPSPTFDRAENLARLKDTTAKLSRGVTPPPVLSPQQITERKSEILESPASFHRQIKIESQCVEASEFVLSASANFKNNLLDIHQVDVNPAHAQKAPANIPECVDANEIQNKSESTADSHPIFYQKDTDLDEDLSELSVLSASVKEKREFFEEAQKAEINKTYVRKDPIDIPERLGPDMDESDTEKEKEKDELPRADMPNLVNKFESPDEKLYTRKELIPLAERLQNEAKITHGDKEEADILEKDISTFDIQAIKNVFEWGEQTSPFKEEKGDSEEPMSSLSEATADTSKQDSPQEKNGSSRQSTPLTPQKDVVETVPTKPPGHSETKSITEHFSGVVEFGNKVTGTRTTVTEQSESVSAQPAPFSYADAVKRKAASVRRTQTYDDAATEKLLSDFHKTWTESETVFKSLGYSVSEETTSQVVSHQTKTVSSGKTHVPRSELCTVCRRRAYPMDTVIVDKKKYHKSCFRCEHCSSKLSLGNYVSLHGHFYCLHHYKQLLKSKGNYDDGLGQKPPTESGGPIPSNETRDWRYSMGSSTEKDKTNTVDKAIIKMFDESKPNSNKISVVWPPHADLPKKTFQLEEDIQLTKPQWPPPDNSPKSPKQQHRKAVPRSVL